MLYFCEFSSFEFYISKVGGTEMFELHQKLKNMKSSYKDIHVCLDVLFRLSNLLLLLRTRLKKKKKR